jgi:glutamate racemase
MIDAKVDTIILGCTHFPLLSEAISKVMGGNVNLVNMGTATAIAIKELLQNTDSLSESNQSGQYKFYVSDRTQSFKKTVSVLLNQEIDDRYVEQVDINNI